MSYVVGVDIGGTCTDCVVMDDQGHMTVGKAFSTPQDFTRGILDALAVVADSLELDRRTLLEQSKLFLHATTMAENAIVDGKLAPAGMLVTRGFEDTLRIMRGAYAQWSGKTEDEIKDIVSARRPPPLIPIRMIVGIRERIDGLGEVLAAPDREEIEAATRALLEKGAQAIGVAFLWSFVNPVHERLAQAVIRECHQDVFCTASHEIAPIMGEFERAQTVALNIRLGPTISKYLNSLGQALGSEGFHSSLLVMQAYGGLLGAEEAAARPVGLIESGPVSGLVGSKALGAILGFGNIIGVDMGGTTFKAGVVNEGLIDYEREPKIFQYHYALPKMNVVSIGVAGGSIVSLDPQLRTPRLGPNSAGADPGPACYGFGGEEPTLTDVDVLLGYLDERFFLGGRARLNRDAAYEVFKTKVADPLGMDVLEAAGEVYRLANSMIYDLLHRLTIERGLDPRSYVMFAYGGTAGMHVTAFAEELSVRRIILPHSAAVHGAFGLLTADVTHEEQVTHPMRIPADPQAVNGLFSELQQKVRGELHAEGFDDPDIALSRAIELRYRRQVHVVTTPVSTGGELSQADLERVAEDFNRLYEERFGKGSGYKEAGIEMVNFRLRGVGSLRKPELRGAPLGSKDPRPALVESRRVYFSSPLTFLEANCYDFEKLSPGNEVAGPALIWTPITTIVINPGQQGWCDEYKNLHLTF